MSISLLDFMSTVIIIIIIKIDKWISGLLCVMGRHKMKMFVLFVTHIFQMEHENSEYRFIGVSVPKELKCSSYSWDLICNASVMPPVKQRKLLEAFV